MVYIVNANTTLRFFGCHFERLLAGTKLYHSG